MTTDRETILGIEFFTGSTAEATTTALDGGLILAPSGPGLAGDLCQSPVYRQALQQADLNLTDSGLLLLLWRWRTGRRLPRLSGLGFLRMLLRNPALRPPGRLFCVVPDQAYAERNATWLRSKDFEISVEDAYVAPFYGPGEITDEILVARIRERRPAIVLIAIGGGVQERLGLYLKQALTGNDSPGIVCIGAALAFLNQSQVHIPAWVDQAKLGWLWRIASSPKYYGPRYWRAGRLVGLVTKYGEKSPVTGDCA